MVMGVDINTLLYQIPGGMLSNLVSQLKQAGKSEKLQEVLNEGPRFERIWDIRRWLLLQARLRHAGCNNVIAGERYK